MATRGTESEIRILEAQIKKTYPNLSFATDHTTGECAVYPGAIEVQGLTVSRWDGGTPYVKWEQWEITELIICSECGEEWKSIAIGECNSLCSDCAEAMRKARDPRADDEVKADTAARLATDLGREEWNQ